MVQSSLKKRGGERRGRSNHQPGPQKSKFSDNLTTLFRAARQRKLWTETNKTKKTKLMLKLHTAFPVVSAFGSTGGAPPHNPVITCKITKEYKLC
jgi:hypothetical protein